MERIMKELSNTDLLKKYSQAFFDGNIVDVISFESEVMRRLAIGDEYREICKQQFSEENHEVVNQYLKDKYLELVK